MNAVCIYDDDHRVFFKADDGTIFGYERDYRFGVGRACGVIGNTVFAHATNGHTKLECFRLPPGTTITEDGRWRLPVPE